MEVKSEQKYAEVAVTDIDIAFPGDLQTFTLRDGVDAYEQAGDELVMSLAGGMLTFHLNHAHWYAIKHRTIRVPVQEKPEAPTTVKP